MEGHLGAATNEEAASRRGGRGSVVHRGGGGDEGGGSVRGRGEGDHGQVTLALHSPEWCVSVVYSFFGIRVILALSIVHECLRSDINA